jgi:hypothetical protein
MDGSITMALPRVKTATGGIQNLKQKYDQSRRNFLKLNKGNGATQTHSHLGGDAAIRQIL